MKEAYEAGEEHKQAIIKPETQEKLAAFEQIVAELTSAEFKKQLLV